MLNAKQVDYDTLKPELNIFWDNADTKAKVERYIVEAKNRLDRRFGKHVDYLEGSEEGAILIALVKYKYNNIEELFEGNYSEDLNSLRLKHQAEV